MTFSGLITRFAFPDRPAPFRWVIAAAVCVLIAWAARLLVEPVLRGGLIWAMFWPALVIATVWAGGRAAALAIGLSVLVASISILPLSPLNETQKLMGLVIFVLMGGLVGAIVAVLRGALGEVERALKARDAAEQDRAESEIRFRTMADSADAPIWVTTAAGGVEFVNRGMADFFGLEPDELTGEVWQQRVHPEDLPALAAQRAEARKTSSPYTFHARFLGADGRWAWTEARCNPRFDAAGTFLGYVGIAFDVTETRQAQSDLRRINDLLAERVEAALAEKEQAEAALRHAQKLEAVGRLTGGVAHDFNNLLTVVIGALEIVLKNPDDADKRRRMAEAAMTAARRGERLTHQLLAFSRRQALRPELCSVDKVLHESDPLLRRVVGETIDLDIRTDGAAPVVRIDVGQFEAAVVNLLVNAKDATPDGGAVTIESGVRDVRDGEAPETAAGRYVFVTVADTGEGMPDEVLKRVFEPFFTTKPIGKGTGLGLSQVYGFARQSGGGVAIESRPGSGTRVTLLLPLADGDAEAQTLRFQPIARSEGRPLEVLLVEDDPEVAAIAETMLRDLGHAVVLAEDGDRALRALDGVARFDLLLTDVIMPGGMDGVALARRVTELRPEIEVILTSGYAGDDVDSALADAPWPLLRKPYSDVELGEILQSVRPRADQPA